MARPRKGKRGGATGGGRGAKAAAGGKRGRGRPPKKAATPKAATPEEIPRSLNDEIAYVLASPFRKVLFTPMADSPTTKRRGGASGASKLAKSTVKGSSDFDSPSPPRKGRGRHANVPESDEEAEGEEEEQEVDEEETAVEDEEETTVEEDEEITSEEEKPQTRLGSPPRNIRVPLFNRQEENDSDKMNMDDKVQRLRNDPRFQGIKPETLTRVVEQFETDPVAPSVIINTSTCKPVPRRTRVAWTNEEVDALRLGVAKHGTHWAKILRDPELTFLDRTQVDLKDKWRNINSKRVYSEMPIRRFLLVNENHDPVYTEKGSIHSFNNRWPADAAVKCATKDWIYKDGASGTVRIYLQEVLPEGKEDATPEVHVFDVSRRPEIAIDIPKFQALDGMRGVWVGEAKKVCTERLIPRKAFVEDIHGKKSAGSL